MTELFTVPVLIKSEQDDYYVIEGIASTADRDLQNEVIDQKGLDVSALGKGKLLINDNHAKESNCILGIVDDAKATKKGLYIKGRVFKNHPGAQAYVNVIKAGGYVGWSVEGSVAKRDELDKGVIRQAKLSRIALTFNPVNERTYAKLVKSLCVDAGEETNAPETTNNVLFTEEQVLTLIKALTAGAGYTKVPTERSGGEALSQESLDKKKDKKKLKKIACMEKSQYQDKISQLLDMAQKKHPEHSREVLWGVLKESLSNRE